MDNILFNDRTIGKRIDEVVQKALKDELETLRQEAISKSLLEEDKEPSTTFGEIHKNFYSNEILLWNKRNSNKMKEDQDILLGHKKEHERYNKKYSFVIVQSCVSPVNNKKFCQLEIQTFIGWSQDRSYSSKDVEDSAKGILGVKFTEKYNIQDFFISSFTYFRYGIYSKKISMYDEEAYDICASAIDSFNYQTEIVRDIIVSLKEKYAKQI